MKFGNLSVRARLLITFGSLGLLVVVVAITALLALSQSNARFENYVL